MLSIFNFTKPFQYLNIKLIANYVEFSEMFAAVTNIAHLLYQPK